jgi:hypothetical protein
MKKQLNEDCVRFIIQALACSMPPSQIAKGANISFMAEISEEDVRLYDPTLNLSSDHLTPYLIRVFAATRAFYLAGLMSALDDESAAGHATAQYRLAVLQNAVERAMAAKQDWLTMEILEEAAKESNNWYEGDGDDSTRNETLIRLVTLTQDLDEMLQTYQGNDS